MTTTSIDRGYGWVMVAIGALMTCVAIGAIFSLAVFLDPMTRDTGWSRAGVSAAMTLNFLSMGIAGFGWGALSDRIGTRRVVLAGSVLLGLGLFLASRATTQTGFLLSYGVVVGVAAGSFFAPMIAAVMAWFERYRSLAVSLVSVGVGVAPMTISPFAAWLVTQTDWRSAQVTIAVLVWVLLIPAALFVRPAPEAAPRADAGSAPMGNVGSALRSPQFIVLALTFFACCAAHSGPIFHTISYAIACGVPAMAAVTVYSVEGVAGLGGRVALGLLADRYGVKPVLITGLASRRSPRGLSSSPRAWGSSMPWRRCSALRTAASCRSMRYLRGSISASASSAPSWAPPPWCRAWAWRLGRWAAAGSMTASAATPGCTSARSQSGLAPWRSRWRSRLYWARRLLLATGIRA